MLLGRAPRVLVTIVLYSANAVSTAMRGTFDVFDDTNGKMTLHVTREFLRLAPSHSPNVARGRIMQKKLSIGLHNN